MPACRSSRRCRWFCLLVVCYGLVVIQRMPPGWPAPAVAQEAAPYSPPTADPVAAAPDERPAEAAASQAAASNTKLRQDAGINFFALMVKGGWLMIPIGLMSLLSTIVVIERFIALRAERVLPRKLVHELGSLGGSQGTFDPREAYRVCQRYPSAASNVVRGMLLKVGRPHSEVEHTVTEASEREADRLYANVRWLNLAAGVTPMIGLLGTVWGMIEAFHRTTLLAPGQNKAEELATGIYIALVTTYGGLMVAIPSAIFAHHFEGRIQMLFHRIDEMLFSLLPQIERYEGRVRFGQPAGGEQNLYAPVEPLPLEQQ